jgi:hypothetical protein
MQLKVKEALAVLRNEIEKELNQNNRVPFILLSQLYYDKINEDVLKETENYLDQLNNYYLKRFNRANNLRDELIHSFQETREDKEAFLKLKRENTNENLTTFVRNSNSLERIIEWKGQLVRKIDPIYLNPENDFVKAHFYAPNKKLFGFYVDTYWVNILVMWVYNLLLYLSLHFRLLRRLIEYFTYKKLI